MTTATVSIRPERGQDPTEIAAISDLLVRTFDETIQQRLVAAMRSTAEYLPKCSLVAEIASEIVGYVMVSRAWLEGPAGRRDIVSLAPLAVDRDRHGDGIGGALLDAVAAAADDGTCPILVLEGPPAYYTRHGFEPGDSLGIRSVAVEADRAGAPLVRRLSSWTPGVTGRVIYPDVFRATLVDER